MVITINHTLKLITGKRNEGCVDPSMRKRAEIPCLALSSLAIPAGRAQSDRMDLGQEIHSPLQPHLQTTKQENRTAQAALNAQQSCSELA